MQLEAEPAESTASAGMIREIDRGLGARWVRLIVDWSRLEPTRGAYAPAELARLDARVDELHAAGVKVILTTCYLPAWATDSYWWSHPPAGYADGPQAFYPIRDGALRDYRRPGRVPCAPLQGPCAGARVLERAQPVAVHLSAAHRRRPLLRRSRVPAHAQGVPRGRGARSHRHARRRRRHRPRGPGRHLPHQPAALRPLPAASARGALLRRLLAPSVHARRVDLRRPRHSRPTTPRTR